MTATEDNVTRALHEPGGGLRAARWAAPVPFLITGLIFASYFVRIPSMKLEFGLSDGQLGLFLMLPILTGLLSMQMTGSLVARFGSAVIVRLMMAGLPLALLGFALADNLVQFAIVLLVFGAVDGWIDVSMNAHAIAVERELKRHIMNSCHAAWSIGSAIGSVLGGIAIKANLTITEHYLLVAATMVLLGLVAGRFMLSTHADRTGKPVASEKPRTSWRSGWTSRVLLFGVTGTVVLVSGGMVGNWSGIFLHDELGATLATASLGYICFSVCEAAGRLFGDRLHDRIGASILVRWSGAIAVAGLAIAVLSPAAWGSIAGFALHGLGLSVLVPIIFSAVGHSGADSDSANAAAALAKVNTLTYSGLLVGPVLVGWFAHGFGLTATMAGLLVLLGVILTVGLRRI